MLLNSRVQSTDGKISLHPEKWMSGKTIKSISKTASNQTIIDSDQSISYQLPGFGIEVFTVKFN